MRGYNYKKIAENYDILETSSNSERINHNIDRTLKQFGVKSVWDITCGTGLQSIYLHKKGYKVTASDYSKDMLAIAQKKYPLLRFRKADMRNDSLGKFDAIISIFNAIGHLSKKDFGKALDNIHDSLNEGGIYVFDIFNLDYMRKHFIPYEFLDTAEQIGDTKFVRFNHNKMDFGRGLMSMNQRTYIQKGNDRPSIIKDEWDMQIYSTSQLKEILQQKGFKVIKFLALDGSRFEIKKSSFILTVARKN